MFYQFDEDVAVFKLRLVLIPFLSQNGYCHCHAFVKKPTVVGLAVYCLLSASCFLLAWKFVTVHLYCLDRTMLKRYYQRVLTLCVGLVMSVN